MDTFLQLITSVKVIGPLGVIAIVEGWVIYQLFLRLEATQNKRLEDWSKIKDEYTQLSADINSTLDTVLKVLGRKNGNGDKNA